MYFSAVFGSGPRIDPGCDADLFYHACLHLLRLGRGLATERELQWRRTGLRTSAAGGGRIDPRERDGCAVRRFTCRTAANPHELEAGDSLLPGDWVCGPCQRPCRRGASRCDPRAVSVDHLSRARPRTGKTQTDCRSLVATGGEHATTAFRVGTNLGSGSWYAFRHWFRHCACGGPPVVSGGRNQNRRQLVTRFFSRS